MNKCIYYRIRHEDGMLILESGVMTNFGGMAWNFVRNNSTSPLLIEYAQINGWIKYGDK